ncbi:MAG: hypothetical protein JWQ23_1384 [Herminiimonas sp.]|nr:hypothetical protein [Herminiimonas sp.]
MTAQANNNEQSKQSGDDGILENIARAIDPPSREVSDEELIDPGTHARKSGEKENKPNSPNSK